MKYAKKRGIPLDVAVARADRRAARAGCIEGDRMGELEQDWPGTGTACKRFFDVAGEQGLQDAHPRAALEVPRLHALRGLRRRAPQARCAAVAARASGHSIRARPDAAADRARARLLRRAAPARAARRGHRPAARRDPRAARLPRATSASATSRSTASRARSPAAKCSASTSPPRSAPRSSTRCSCSTSRRSACTRATWAA